MLALFLGGGCQQKSAAEGKGPAIAGGDVQPMDAPSATIVVHGMGCPQCASSVNRLLMDVPGVKNVNVDLGSGHVTVLFADAPHPSRVQLADAVRKSGYTLVRIDTP